MTPAISTIQPAFSMVHPMGLVPGGVQGQLPLNGTGPVTYLADCYAGAA